MILHILTDDKFADYAIAQFSAPKMKSEFVLIPSNGVLNLVKLTDRCTIVRQHSPEFEALLNRLDQYTGIILHGLFWGQWQTELIQRIPEHVKIAWMYWGGEVYARHEFKERFWAPITGFICRLHTCIKKEVADTFWEIPLGYYKRVDYCLTDAEEEYALGKELTGGNFKHLWYNYYSIEETIGALVNKQCCGRNILVGNSASEWNNHLDVLWTLSKMWRYLDEGKSQIIIPLSYGSPWIRNLVLKVGKRLFGSRVLVLADYLPRDEYNAIMLSCSTLILNYWEPAAQGNIITGLWLGMRVYLSERSASYYYFKRIGCKIYSIEYDLNRNNPNVFAPMSQEDIDTNRSVLRKWYSKEEMHKRNLEIVKALS